MQIFDERIIVDLFFSLSFIPFRIFWDNKLTISWIIHPFMHVLYDVLRYEYSDIHLVIFRVLYTARTIEHQCSRSCPARPTFYRFYQLSKTFTQLFSSLAENFAGESWFNVTMRVCLATVFSSTCRMHRNDDFTEMKSLWIFPSNNLYVSPPLSREMDQFCCLFFFFITVYPQLFSNFHANKSQSYTASVN